MHQCESEYEVLYSEEGDGFITREFLAEHVIEGSDIYVCGPAPFMQAVISSLQGLEFPKKKFITNSSVQLCN